MAKVIIRGVSVVVVTAAVADIALVMVVSSSNSGCGPRDATEAQPLTEAKPLADDGCIAGLPLGGEKGEEGLAGDAERWWLAQAPRGRLLDLIHEGDEVIVERAEGVDHEGRKRRANGLSVSIVFEVFGSATALDGLARAAGAAEVGGGERVDSG